MARTTRCDPSGVHVAWSAAPCAGVVTWTRAVPSGFTVSTTALFVSITAIRPSGAVVVVVTGSAAFGPRAGPTAGRGSRVRATSGADPGTAPQLLWTENGLFVCTRGSSLPSERIVQRSKPPGSLTLVANTMDWPSGEYAGKLASPCPNPTWVSCLSSPLLTSTDHTLLWGRQQLSPKAMCSPSGDQAPKEASRSGSVKRLWCEPSARATQIAPSSPRWSLLNWIRRPSGE